MDVTEILEQMAYDMLQDKEYKDKLVQQISLERQEGQSAKEESEGILRMFKAMGL